MPRAYRSAKQWPPVAVTSIRDWLEELDTLLQDQARDPDADSTAQWLARLLVVRSCGYLEQTVLEVAKAFIVDSSGGLVRSFAQSHVPEGRNPSPDFLLDWVGRFDAQLREDLDEVLEADDQRLRRELSFLVDRRNRIAHGLNEGITSRKALDLKVIACEAADWFILRFNPAR